MTSKKRLAGRERDLRHAEATYEERCLGFQRAEMCPTMPPKRRMVLLL